MLLFPPSPVLRNNIDDDRLSRQIAGIVIGVMIGVLLPVNIIIVLVYWLWCVCVYLLNLRNDIPVHKYNCMYTLHNFVCGLMYRKRHMSGQYASVEKGSIKNVSCDPTTEIPIGKIPLSALSYLSKPFVY